ncbi:plasma serine protease inhibitor [Myotis daubentonii]|uniref:plasma serine protease inhibitor n=1 Tax=Myotis daubentonii TaxID=98922 RepID=UPI00287318FA|nr:plasma serine protease inhibitor [Myotis daubentonii]
MQLRLLLCLVLFSPQGSGLHHQHSWRTKKRVRELPPTATATATATTTATATPTTATPTTATPAHRNFTFDLFRALVAANPNQNIFFSPLSISMPLAMISLGARGSTKAQILEGLGLSAQGVPEEDELHQGFHRLLRELRRPREDLQLSLGNTLFVRPAVPVRDAFLGAMRTLYLADAVPTNFEDPEAAQKQINDYVAKETKGKIVDLVKDLDSSEVMVMVSYIFFKAKWETRFDPQSTSKQDFHVTAETVVQVPMMKREDEYDYLLDRRLYCRVVGLRYQGNATALFILPSEGRMQKAEAGLDQETLTKWLKKFTKRKLQLYLPKFSIEGSYQLEKILPTLGIRDLFTSHADLGGFTNHSNIQVSEMVHKAVVEVDESGTQAAAATGMVLGFRSARMGSQLVVFNRPFLMAIVNPDGVLFLGKVARPAGGHFS